MILGGFYLEGLIFGILACLVYITPDNFPADKKDRPCFPQTVVLTSVVDLIQTEQQNFMSISNYLARTANKKTSSFIEWPI